MTTWRGVRGGRVGRASRLALVAGLTVVSLACSGVDSVSGPDAVTAPIAAQAPGDAGNAILRVRCESDSARSRVTVDGNNLAPGTYRAIIRSGSRSVTSEPRAAVGDEVEFDFDSNANDIAAGAAPIAAAFIQGSRVEASLLNAGGQVVTSSVASCSWR